MKHAMGWGMALLLALGSACSGKDEGRRPAPTRPTILSVHLAPGQLSLEPGQTTVLEATVRGEGDFDPSVLWESRDTTVVAVEDGVVQAVSLGTATILARSKADPSKWARAQVQVVEPPPPTGNLLLSVRNLPEEVIAALEVTGPRQYLSKVNASTLLEGLVPGAYTVTAKEVADASYRYHPPATEMQVEVEEGETAELTIEYTAQARYFRISAEDVTLPVYGTQELRVELERLEGFEGKVHVRLEDLSPHHRTGEPARRFERCRHPGEERGWRPHHRDQGPDARDAIAPGCKRRDGRNS